MENFVIGMNVNIYPLPRFAPFVGVIAILVGASIARL